ncbi:MAG: hypothetical protein D3903_06510, partial [Candidatus Electrothrix sp. GM3_4]|nr:hypothetical protein [Candidatus Electrothrix sp. GM3_4]
MLRASLNKVVMVISVLCLLVLIFSAQASIAAGEDIRKFCAPQGAPSQPLQLFFFSDIGSQQAALQRNKTLQEGNILFSTREGDALFHTTRIEPGDCVLLNLKEGMQLRPVAVSANHGLAPSKSEERARFFPAVFFVRKDKSKHYGLIAEKVLRHLRPVKKARETATAVIVNARTDSDPDLILIYIICPADRNSPCDFTIKQNGEWLLDKKTGKQFHLSVLARSQRNGKPSRTGLRTHIN